MERVNLKISMMILVIFSLLFLNEVTASSQEKISRFPIPNVESLPQDIQSIMSGTEKKLGFVPNVQKAFTYRTEYMKAFFNLYKSIQRKGTGLTDVEREMMIIVHSVYNHCTYCITSHSWALNNLIKDPELVLQLQKDYRKADLTPRQRALVEFALRSTKDPHSINENDFEILRSHGLSDDDIFDAGAYVAFFNMSNRMMSLMDVVPNDDYKIK